MKKLLLTTLLIAAGFLLKAQNVGIGTTTPADKLHIVIGNNASGGLLIGEASKKIIFLGDSTTTNESAVLRLFNNSEIENVRIGAITDSWFLGGDVGIGTNTPSSRLHIISSGASTALQVARSGGTPLFKIMEGGLGNGALSVHNSNGDTSIQMNSSGNSWLLGGNVGIGTNGPSAKLHVFGSFKLENGTEAANRLLVSNSSGTATWTDPSAAGLVSGSGAASRLAFWQSSDSITSSSLLNWDNINKFLGIGSSTPSEKLDIVLGANENGGLRIGESSKKVAFLGDSTTTNENGVLRLFDNSQTETVRFGANTSSFLMGGNVGIGTTTPNTLLTIRGLDPQIQLQGNSGADRGFFSLSGNDAVIGTNSSSTGNFVIKTGGLDRVTVNSSNGVVIMDANNSSGYAATIENEAYQGSGLLLSIKSNNTYGPTNNFIGFRHWNGSNYYTNGCIEGFKYSIWDQGHVNNLCEVYDMIGIPSDVLGMIAAYADAQVAALCMDDGVRYQSTGADYAEWLPREDPSKKILPASVVGVKNGKISYVTEGADQVMAISTRAVVLGNMPQDDKKADYETVAFIGQVLIWVQGNVNAGDYIVASGKNNGAAVAVSPDNITIDDMKNILGRSWETKKGEVNLVNTVVGVKNAEYASIMKKQIDKTKQMEEQMAKIAAELNQVKESQAKDIELIKKMLNMSVRN